MYENREVEMKFILEPPHQLRMSFDEEKLQELAASMQQQGLINPITLHEDKEGRLIIIAGHRRFLAAKILKWEIISARVKQEMSGIEIVTVSAIENLQRENLDVIEESDLICKMHYDEKLSIGEICDIINRKRPWVQARLEVMMFQPEVLEALQQKTIKLGVSRLIAGIQDEGFRKWVLDMTINSGATEQMVSTWIKDNFQSLSEADRLEIIEAASETACQYYEKTKFSCDLCYEPDTLSNVMICRVCKECYLRLQAAKEAYQKEQRSQTTKKE